MKNTVILSLLISAFISITGTAHAAVQMRGMAGCGDWVEGRQKVESYIDLNNRSWLLGFLSGIAVALDKDFLIGTDSSSLYLWMDNYCKSYPLKDIRNGGINLSFELIKQKGL